MKTLNKFFFSQANSQGMIICRVTFGAILFFYYLSVIPHFGFDFGAHGIFGYDFFQVFPNAEPFKTHLQNFQWLHFMSSNFLLWILLLTLIVSSACFALGIRTLASGAIALILHSAFHGQNEYMFGGWGDFIKPFMIYVLLFEYVKNKKENIWPIRLLQIHMCTIYFVAAYARLFDPSWLNGSVVFETLQQSHYGRFAFVPLWIQPFTEILTYLTWGLELTAPVLLWTRFRKWAALALIGMHFGMEIFILLGWWNWMMIAALTVFLPPEWLSKKRFALLTRPLQSLGL